jgi:HEPN domain-containing protein
METKVHIKKSELELVVVELNKEYEPQQPFIDRAEEDLITAYYLYCNTINGYILYVSICYLCLQGIEKWLKAFLAVNKVLQKFTHDIPELLKAAVVLDNQFLGVLHPFEDIEEYYFRKSGKKPANYSSMRYEISPTNIEIHVKTLLEAAFLTRRLAKRSLRRRSDERTNP